MKELVLVVVLLAVTRGLEFGLTIDPYETQCFYEQLAAQAKYNVEVIPDDRSRYEFSIRTTGESARDIFVKETSGDMEPVRLSKFAPEQNYYSFCTRNLLDVQLRISFKLQTGLELMELEVLPDKTDNEYLDREVQFLEQQHNQLFKSLEAIDSARQATDVMLNLMSNKLIGFGIAGFLVIIIVNYCFYREVKRTLEKRKLI